MTRKPRTRTHNLRIDLSDKERAQLTAITDDLGTTVATWVRLQIRDAYNALLRDQLARKKAAREDAGS